MAKMQNKRLAVFDRSGVITIHNRQRIIIEGVERIIFCNSEKMIIKSRHLTKISGQRLHLLQLGNQNIAIVGQIDSLEFDKGTK